MDLWEYLQRKISQKTKIIIKWIISRSFDPIHDFVIESDLRLPWRQHIERENHGDYDVGEHDHSIQNPRYLLPLKLDTLHVPLWKKSINLAKF